MIWPFGDLPQFRYGAILVDPPWRMKMYSVKGMGRSPDELFSRESRPGWDCWGNQTEQFAEAAE